MCYVSFDWIDVVADFAFTWSKVSSFAVGSESCFDGWFVFLFFFGHVFADIVDYLDAYCGSVSLSVGCLRLDDMNVHGLFVVCIC